MCHTLKAAENRPSRARSWHGFYLAFLFGSLIFDVFADAILTTSEVVGWRSLIKRTSENDELPSAEVLVFLLPSCPACLGSDK